MISNSRLNRNLGLSLKLKKHKNPGILFVLPALIAIAFVLLYPLLYTFYLSFYKSDLYSDSLEFVGFTQYIELFQNELFINSIKATFIWTFGSVCFQFLIGLFAAVVLSQEFIKYKTLIRILIMLPWVIPSIIGVQIWEWSYHPDFGIINHFLQSAGLISEDIKWLSSQNTALLSAIIVNVWKMFPFVMLMIEASLQSVPNQLKEAARIDGANIVRTFFTVTVPHISTTCYTVILLLVIWTLNAFTFIFALTEGGPAHSSEILSMFIYIFAFQNFEFGKASAASVVLFLFTTMFAIIYITMLMRGDEKK
ncbi:sugar ABC transporter permease [Gracilibacillus sp. YIM 98692]|uniref:carbohydrate ABC transporter permease n=1 Tax=Gracilibacillus sp. YIM 98692 TaxID=2663532 RepID=UPI0013D706D2|nr:sugar ABC transporter permease [Gracilibacillus sp. YIM 98692]